MTARRGIGPNVVTALALIGMLGAMVFLMGTVDRQDREMAVVSANNDALHSQVEDQGVTPVAPLAETVTGKSGNNGIDGISIKGEPGRPPTAAEVASSVASYCTIHLDCTGATGAIGPVSIVPGPIGNTGAAGADSTTEGPPGAVGADSQVPGPIGLTGLTGAGIASILCQDDGYWLFTLTQPEGTTTTQTVAGPCRVDPIITPTQGVTP
ncbi:hypothetical protein E3T26_14500 [Cryobacterium sp. TMT1-21]|uniref:hypothetical protein n=1 Tax=Cryobacterium sp. TMT1-21 TaxID=1259234 RepID=UPI0010691A74|nr:hypothetical protein [Cryobacterium sp. TMT1-21]TFD09834.1 hypothetical protein E3T26_14500 [Cryobacterium sp. TMT1-21]